MIEHLLRHWVRIIASHPLRNFLLILTTTIGTGALGISLQTTARLDRLIQETTGGQDRRFVIANASVETDGSLSWARPVQFAASDQDLILNGVRGIKAVSIVNQLPMDQILVGNSYWKPSRLLGTDNQYAQVMGLTFLSGSFFSADQLSVRDKVIIISERAAHILFLDANAAVGQSISIDNGMRNIPTGSAGAQERRKISPWSTFVVGGVFKDPSRFESENYGIPDFIAPYTSLLPAGMSFRLPVRMLVARVNKTTAKNVEAALRPLFDSRAGTPVSLAVWEGSPDSPGVSTIEEARSSLASLSLVTSGLGLLILIIAAFGIVSGLLVDAADRASEIALKRAVGMTVIRGTLDLCARSVALAGAGGVAGLVLATLFSIPLSGVLVPFLDALGISSSDLHVHLFEFRTLLAPVAALSLAGMFSIFPAVHAASNSIVEGLHEQ